MAFIYIIYRQIERELNIAPTWGGVTFCPFSETDLVNQGFISSYSRTNLRIILILLFSTFSKFKINIRDNFKNTRFKENYLNSTVSSLRNYHNLSLLLCKKAWLPQSEKRGFPITIETYGIRVSLVRDTWLKMYSHNYNYILPKTIRRDEFKVIS